MNLNRRTIILLIFVIFVVGVGIVVLMPLLRIIPYSSTTANWEIATGTSRILINGQQFDLDSESVPFDGYIGSAKSYIKLDNSGYDVEKLYGGTTGVQVSVGNPVHIGKNTFTGEWQVTGDSEPYRTYQKYVGDTLYEYRHDVWRVDIEIRTDGAVKPYGIDYIGTCEGLPAGIGVTPIDHYANVRVFFGFITQPWEIVGEVIDSENSDAQYEVQGTWTGVMSASILDIPFIGAVPGSSENPQYKGEVDAMNTKGSAINMYDTVGYPIGLGLDSAGSDTKPLGSIANVPTKSMLEVTAKVEPGLKITYDGFGSWASATPVDNYVTYTVRVDTVGRATGFLISGDQPTITTPTNPEPEPDIPTIWELIFGGLGAAFSALFSNPLVLTIIIVIVVVIVLIFFLRIMFVRRLTGN